jgi:hypothetical protein
MNGWRRNARGPLGAVLLSMALCVLATGCGTQSPAVREAAWLRAHVPVLAGAPAATRQVIAALGSSDVAARRHGCTALASYAEVVNALPAIPLTHAESALATMRTDLRVAVTECRRAASGRDGAAAAAMSAALFDAGQQLRLLGELITYQGKTSR